MNSSLKSSDGRGGIFSSHLGRFFSCIDAKRIKKREGKGKKGKKKK